jgi:ketosteroid isomerase-like protein
VSNRIFPTAQDAENAFYEALERCDLDGMMAVWAEDEDIVCVHPGGARHVGYEAVRQSFEQLFAGDTRLTFRLDQAVSIDTVGLAVQSVVEHLRAGEDGPRGAALATNVLMRTPYGWRMVCHHASPSPPLAETPQTGPLH